VLKCVILAFLIQHSPRTINFNKANHLQGVRPNGKLKYSKTGTHNYTSDHKLTEVQNISI